MSYWTYMVASKSATLYTGVTGNPYRRIFQHKNHMLEGFTAKYDCTRLVWYAEHPYIHDAIAHEKRIKGWTRAKKEALIRGENPHWNDLAELWGARILMPNEMISDQKD